MRGVFLEQTEKPFEVEQVLEKNAGLMPGSRTSHNEATTPATKGVVASSWDVRPTTTNEATTKNDLTIVVGVKKIGAANGGANKISPMAPSREQRREHDQSHGPPRPVAPMAPRREHDQAGGFSVRELASRLSWRQSGFSVGGPAPSRGWVLSLRVLEAVGAVACAVAFLMVRGGGSGGRQRRCVCCGVSHGDIYGEDFLRCDLCRQHVLDLLCSSY